MTDVTPTVFLVDDDPAVRRSLSKMVSLAGHNVVALESAERFLEEYDQCQPGCLVLDVRMPGMDGMTLLATLQERAIRVPVILLTGHGDVPMAVEAMSMGAFTFLQKPAASATLLENIEKAIETDAATRSKSVLRDDLCRRLASLTPREREVCDLLADGKSPGTIATILGNSESTVRVQKVSLLRKLGYSSVAELMHAFLTYQPNDDPK